MAVREFVHGAGPRGDGFLCSGLASFSGVEEVQVFEHFLCPLSGRRLMARVHANRKEDEEKATCRAE